jgi:hypothetical protein
MTHPMRDFRDVLRDGHEKMQAHARTAFGPVDIYPATPAERAADKTLRKLRARPAPRTLWPRPLCALFALAAFFAGAGLMLILHPLLGS